MSLGRIAQYELLEKIGEGGMGAVFRARDSRLDKVVAVKILLGELARDPESRARFLREARVEASLNHPGIAMCFDVGEARLDPPNLLCPDDPNPPLGKALYLAMEYVPGDDLQSLVGDPPLNLDRVLDLTSQIAAGLDSAHRLGVIHRDLKPTNIRVMPDGRVKIVDFGLSRIAMSKDETATFATSKGHVMGTVYFMAPEQARGRTTDPRSDLFSLGVIAYQLITGKLPFTGDTDLAVANAVATEEPPPLARYANHVPDELERVVRKLIAKDPEQRYQSAHEVRTDLERLREGTRKHPGWSGRRVAVARVAVALLIVGAGWTAWSLLRPEPMRTIAVMPFRNRTGDTRLDYLCDGIAANVVGDLVRGAQLNVASLSSTQGLDSAVSVPRELGVQAVLEGFLRRQGGVTYLDVQLVEARRGIVLWTQRSSYALDDAIAIERGIVREVVQRMAGRDQAAYAASTTTESRSNSAYDLYVRGGSYLEDPDDPLGPDRALELFTKATDVDPDFALAWAGKSRALWKIWNRDKTEAPLRMGEEAANRAIRLNPELLEARVARAQIFRATSRYPEAIHELEEVLRLNPNWDEALIQIAAAYRGAGDMAREEASLRQAVSLRPGYWRNWNQLGGYLARRGNYPGARAAYQEVIRLLPAKNLGYQNLGAIEILQGDYGAAAALYDRLPTATVDFAAASNIGTAYFFEHRLDDARAYFALALTLQPRNHIAWYNLGDLHVREGKSDSARADFVQAQRLLDDRLHVDPKNATLKLDRAICLAKAGQCDAARTALLEIEGTLPADDADNAHQIAKLFAVCNRRAEAMEAVRRAVRLGVSPRLLRAEDDFRPLAADPQFLALTGPKSN